MRRSPLVSPLCFITILRNVEGGTEVERARPWRPRRSGQSLSWDLEPRNGSHEI